eukprot:scaffold1558_cov403-Prasinococcus_capsulatus_cf.AAC.41
MARHGPDRQRSRASEPLSEAHPPPVRGAIERSGTRALPGRLRVRERVEATASTRRRLRTAQDRARATSRTAPNWLGQRSAAQQRNMGLRAHARCVAHHTLPSLALRRTVRPPGPRRPHEGDRSGAGLASRPASARWDK